MDKKLGLKIFWVGDEPFSPLPSDEMEKLIHSLKALGYELSFYNDRLLAEKTIEVK